MYTRKNVIEKISAQSHSHETDDTRTIEYEISEGYEKWSEKNVPIIKVRMLHDDKAKGYSPSFPNTKQGRKELKDVCERLLKFLEEDN